MIEKKTASYFDSSLWDIEQHRNNTRACKNCKGPREKPGTPDKSSTQYSPFAETPLNAQ